MRPDASWFVTYGIGGIALAVAGTVVWAYARSLRALGWTPVQRKTHTWIFGGGVALWMLVTGWMASSGRLANFEATPPPFLVVFIGVMAVGFGVGLSILGERFATALPLWGLIAFHAYRLPLELVMHRAATEGVMPDVMSFSGRNFDIVTGASAIVVAYLVAKQEVGEWMAWIWNVVGIVLLFNVIQVAVRATPLFKAFGDGPVNLNTWVAYFPFVWLPTVLVAAALAGHLVIFRRLIRGTADGA
ncbi:MAG: hypothetical protein H6685_07370 [Deltaproteobacteria bacterium]|nr:hypothetical protein [Deltaproteobacteria bacterium]